ncbi:uncharacterized protein LOC107502318 isoform X2 [Rousettus aegyptiacus]|uniref:uncharacterized protein LOC107502318 isoform X2 n=1 Tax=Rousettus aegyptiacus TaxID=9407 RepID=UPI00168CB25E|nr:uncharacterized protein LOC107502318 isoform X2 [Rousettus aegyptiacus]
MRRAFSNSRLPSFEEGYQKVMLTCEFGINVEKRPEACEREAQTEMTSSQTPVEEEVSKMTLRRLQKQAASKSHLPIYKDPGYFHRPQKMNFKLLLPNTFSTVWKTCKGNCTVFSISNPSKCCAWE